MTNAQAALIAASNIMGPMVASRAFRLSDGEMQRLAEQYREWLDADDAAESDKKVREAQKELSWTNL